MKAPAFLRAAAGIACGGLLLGLAGCAKKAPAEDPARLPRAYVSVPGQAGSAGVINYEFAPGSDAAADIKEALARAKASGRRVLIEVGGTWCSWCGVLDRFFAGHPRAVALRDAAFVTVKVLSAPSAPNPALAAYPAPPGYPHFFVLNADGTLAESRDTTTLEAGAGYDAAKMDAFLRAWAPPPMKR